MYQKLPEESRERKKFTKDIGRFVYGKGYIDNPSVATALRHLPFTRKGRLYLM